MCNSLHQNDALMQTLREKRYNETMKKEAVYEIAYRTPTGKPGRKQARQSRIVATVENLRDRGYYDIHISSYPIGPCDPQLA